jgi:hypothetical protein
LRRGMGNGNVALNRSGTDQPIYGCGFHKGKSIEPMINRYLKRAVTDRKRGNTPKSTVGGLTLLDGKATFYPLFNRLYDHCIQHDDPYVGLALWNVLIMKLELMRMEDCAAHLQRYHHPVSGRQGIWGRWNNTQEGYLVDDDLYDDQNDSDGQSDDTLIYTELDVNSDHPAPVRRFCTPTMWIVRGGPSTSNGIEARINKLMKMATGTSLRYGPLTTKAQNMLTSLSKDLTGIQFSLVADQQGECVKSQHRKRSGAKTVQQTGPWP